MPKLVTKAFNIYNAKQFINSLNTTVGKNLYLFIARARPWSDENSPPAPVNYNDDSIIWEDIIALKKITSVDVKHVVRRIEWVPGSVYDEYDDTNLELYDANYYVRNSENNVYKCISNNYDSTSTQEPTGKSLNYFTTSDNYKWKYLYTIEDSDELRFVTRDYMPVNTNENVSSVANKGTIENVKVLTLGSNYSNLANLTVSVVGDGANANITPVVSSSNTIIGYTIVNPGINYTYANLYVTGGGGSGANARIIISPAGGHGKNIIDEMYAYKVMINSRLDFAEGGGDFPITNDYRTIGIIESPIFRNTNQEATVITLDSTTTINVNSISGTFSVDEYIIGANSKANAMIISAGNGANFNIKIKQNRNLSNGWVSFNVGENITGTSSAAVANIVSISNSEVLPNTGKVMYMENRKKISRAADQSENIHIVIEF